MCSALLHALKLPNTYLGRVGITYLAMVGILLNAGKMGF